MLAAHLVYGSVVNALQDLQMCKYVHAHKVVLHV